MKTKILIQQTLFILFVLNLQGVPLNSGLAGLHAQINRYVATTGNNSGNNCTNPNNPCATLIHTLNEAASGDIINIAAGSYTQSQSGGLLIQKSITLIGAGREHTFIQAHAQANQASHRVIRIAPLPINVEISSLTVRNGVALGSGEPGRGGGIYYDFDANNPGSLTINDVKFQQNTARVGGGVFSSTGSAPVFETVHFQENSAVERGGGIYNWTDSAPQILNVVFQNNSAEISGGGIYNLSVNLVMNWVNFVSNNALFGCGAMVLQTGSTATITNTAFSGNTTSGNGGGLCMDGNSSATLTDVAFEENIAIDGNGGGMHVVNNSSIELLNVTFTANEANGINEEDGGGGMYLINSNNIFLTNVSFTANVAHDAGGGMLNVESSPVLKNVFFMENQASTGGGMFNAGSSPTFANVVFHENIAGHSGGAMVNSINSNPVLRNVSLAGNTANTNGGGIYNSQNSTPEIHNMIFWGNTAGSNGNEIYNTSNSSVLLYNSLVPDGSEDVVEGGGYTCNDCISDNPMFANLMGGNLQLTENSPAINAGFPNTNPLPFPTNGNGDPIDILSNPRFFGSAIDIGAYEWNDNLSINGINGQLEKIVIYPNPVEDVLYIHSEKVIEQVMLYNLLGQNFPIKDLTNNGDNTFILDFSEINRGVYALVIQSEGQFGNYKIIKQ